MYNGEPEGMIYDIYCGISLGKAWVIPGRFIIRIISFCIDELSSVLCDDGPQNRVNCCEANANNHRGSTFSLDDYWQYFSFMHNSWFRKHLHHAWLHRGQPQQLMMSSNGFCGGGIGRCTQAPMTSPSGLKIMAAIRVDSWDGLLCLCIQGDLRVRAKIAIIDKLIDNAVGWRDFMSPSTLLALFLSLLFSPFSLSPALMHPQIWILQSMIKDTLLLAPLSSKRRQLHFSHSQRVAMFYKGREELSVYVTDKNQEEAVMPSAKGCQHDAISTTFRRKAYVMS